MSLRNLVAQQLALLQQSCATPHVLQATDATGIAIAIDVERIDAIGIEVNEISLFVPQLQNSAFDDLKQWANSLSQQLTYLLENIGPLEYDPNAKQVLIRSTPPQTAPQGTQYYEIILSSSGNGTFKLRRYASATGVVGRKATVMQMTIEALLRLVNDLVSTIP